MGVQSAKKTLFTTPGCGSQAGVCWETPEQPGNLLFLSSKALHTREELHDEARSL